MTDRNRIHRIAVALGTALAGAAGAASLDLAPADLPRLIRERSPRVAAARAGREAAEAAAGHLRRSFYPRLAAEAGGEAWHGPGVGSAAEPWAAADLSINVFRSGRDALESSARDADAVAAIAAEDEVFHEELHEANRAYRDGAAASERLGLLAAAREDAATFLEGAQRRVAAGLTTWVDPDLFALFMADLDERSARSKAGVADAVAALYVALALDPAGEVTFTRSMTHDEMDPLLTAGPAGESPEVRRLRAEAASLTARGRERARWWAPALDVYGRGVQSLTPDRSFAAAADRAEAGFGARIVFAIDPGGAGWESAASEREAFARRALADDALRRMTATIGRTRARLSELHDAAHVSAALAADAAALLDRVRSEYERGVRTASDLLGALERRLDLEERHLDRRIAHAQARAELAHLLGLE